MSDFVTIINDYVIDLAKKFAEDIASIQQLDNIINMLNNNKYYNNIHSSRQLLFITTFLTELPKAITEFKTAISDRDPNEFNGFDINKLFCALDYAISNFKDQFQLTYYDSILNPR